MSIGSILNMARAGMNAQMAAVQTASQNISNATTVGYSKQRVDLATSYPTVFPYGSVGTGVEIVGVTRARDFLLDANYRTNASGSSAADTTSTALTQIQSVFGEPSDSGLASSLDAFWSAWSDLSADPTNSAAKSVVRESGNNVANTLNRFASQISQIDQSNREAMNNDIGQVNAIAKQIAKLNDQIISAESNGNQAPDLRDARDNLLDQVTKITGGQVVERASGSAALYVGGRLIVDGVTVKPLEMTDGQPPTVSYEGSNLPLEGIGGSLGAEIDLSANRIPAVLDQLNTLAKGLVQSVNSIHSAGQVFSGTPPVGSPAGNFFDVTVPPPAGGDPRLTALGIRLSSTLADGSAVATAGATATGPGDNTTALALAGLRDAAVNLTSTAGTAVATATIGDYYTSVVGDLATSTKEAADESTVQNTLTANADIQRQSVSGVSTDEELISIIQHQHAYQAAARLVSVVDEMTQTLIDLGR
jgi:flagellar hook-associated protein 1 FlgK